jgi:membrane associated rhomboid family serine protease
MMLIPIHSRINWKRPPLITLSLILLNVLIFAVFQLDDDEQSREALEYYQESGLAKQELEPALTYAREHDRYDLTGVLYDARAKDFPYWVMTLQTDSAFMNALHNDEVVTPEDQNYEEWKGKRKEFDELYESITFVEYGLRTARPDIVTLFSHMFLHAGFGHIFGNMIFLLAVGFLVEATMDRTSYLALYLLAGLGSAAFDILINSDSLLPGIGASGAIAGLMGAYTVLYGMTRIRFFYFIGVYFDYATMPALVLLPLWLGNEVVQQLMYSNSGINFLAHIGGLISGALLALLVRRYLPSYSLEYVEADKQREQDSQELQKARGLMAEFRPELALPILRRLHNRDPENREILARYYECSRINPSSDEYHALAHAIFSLQEEDVATSLLVRDTFNEYLRLARPRTKMGASLVCQLAKRFVRQKESAEAERLVHIIVTKKVACADREILVKNYLRLLEEQGREKERERLVKLLPAEGAG